MTTNHEFRGDAERPAPVGAPVNEQDKRDVAVATQLLAERLGRLRQARPGFQEQLEARLVARLPVATRPWWRRLTAPTNRDGRVSVSRRRWLLGGLAAAGLAALSLASLAVPISPTREVSAQEILEHAQALAENPLLAKVKSFHLTAKSTGGVGPRAGSSSPLTIEQWFVAPNRMRMESRSQGADGKLVIGGTIGDAKDIKTYGTAGANALDVIGVMPIMAVPVSKNDKLPDPSKEGAAGVFMVRAERDGSGSDAEKRIEIRLDNCPQPKRTGEGRVANRPVYVVEMDHSACLPPEAPIELRGRHVTWADQQTYLPLKIEDYGPDGKLRHSYEVTSIEYDIAIPDSVFTDIPAGTTIQPLPKPLAEPGVEPAPAPGFNHDVVIHRDKRDGVSAPQR